MTGKWIKVNDLSNGQYSVNKNIRCNTPMLRSDLCQYSDAHVVVKRTINLKIGVDDDKSQKDVVLKTNAPFRLCII